MRILGKDLRNGVLKLRLESLDDLWYLSQVVFEGDVVKSKTQRRVKDRDDVKSGGGERKTITLSVRVGKTEFKRDSNSLRISGTIEAGPEDIIGLGSHHTLSIDPGSVLTVVKEKWGKPELSRIDAAVESTLRPSVLVVVVEDGDATVGFLRDSGVDYTEFSRNIGGKYDLKGREDRLKGFHGELFQMLAGLVGSNNVSLVILAGPGFGKNAFMDFVRQKDSGLASKFVVEDTGSGGRNGVQEVLKRGSVNKSLEMVNSVRDTRLVDEVLKNIGAGNGLAVYGFDDVRDAVDSGAVETLIVSDRLFFDDRVRIEPLMLEVQNKRGVVHIVNSEGDAGGQLESLGGLAGILRYRLG
ncbi:MAG: mRNA surveillance protein pelota [Candidatus Altiarchaeota archaeon]